MIAGILENKFKDVSGSIRSIQCHPTHSVVASCGLDRFLRVHDLNTKKLVYKVGTTIYGTPGFGITVKLENLTCD